MLKYPKQDKPKKKGKTQKEKDHLNWVASNPCSVCNNHTVQIHHIREFGEPRDHFKSIPLCYNHHLGHNGIHFLGKKEFRKRYGHELDMLKKLRKKQHGNN